MKEAYRVKDEYRGSLKAIVKQLEKCEYRTPEGMPLENNLAFIALRERAEKEEIEEC